MRMLKTVKRIHLRATLLEVPIYMKTADVLRTSNLFLKLPPGQLA